MKKTLFVIALCLLLLGTAIINSAVATDSSIVTVSFILDDMPECY